MGNKERPELWRKIWLAALIFFFFILLVASFFGERGWVEIYRVQKKKELLQQEIAGLQKKKQELERDIEELQTNPGAVERKARRDLWLMDPDEIVLIKKKK
jgi:cell division protein FtsB